MPIKMTKTDKNDSATVPGKKFPLIAWFLGPKAENADKLSSLVSYILKDYVHWRRNFFPNDQVSISRSQMRSEDFDDWQDFLSTHLDSLLNNLKAHFPFYSPRYLAHMLSEQTIPSIIGYFAGMLYNPNNVTDEAAPVTVQLEIEAGQMVAKMLGYTKQAWTHICSGGTIANIEALWVARTVRYYPFILREYCQKHNCEFSIKTANGTVTELMTISDYNLLNIKPRESIEMAQKLIKHIYDINGRKVEDIAKDLNQWGETSRFNINKVGFQKIIEQTGGYKPLIFISGSAHYSIKKAANLLGYGESSVISIPTTSSFRIDMKELTRKLNSIPSQYYIAAVIGIAGTTEEGAVDPLHSIKFLRDSFEQEKNQSFWFHVDAAWGGYIRSLFCGLPIKDISSTSIKSKGKSRGRLDDIYKEYENVIDAKETYSYTIDVNKFKSQESIEIHWDDPEVYKAFISMPAADSITIDPHKLGYVPYPAGMISFKHGRVTEMIEQKASYIFKDDSSKASKSEHDYDKPKKIDKVGPYILEGSKPGAVAASTWLAHKSIPLEASGHGKIIRTTLLNTKKLMILLQSHKNIFSAIDEEVSGKVCDRSDIPFAFCPVHVPDTNVLCYIVRPMTWKDKKLIYNDISLKEVNDINTRIYEKLSIDLRKNTHHLPYLQEFFVSYTDFQEPEYPLKAIKSLLKESFITDKNAYKSDGLRVLRSTIMNPFYYTAEGNGIKYFWEFIFYLHKVSKEVINPTKSSEQ